MRLGWKIALGTVLGGLLGATAWITHEHRQGELTPRLVTYAARSVIKEPEQLNLIQRLLGFESPQTYLILFLNNTELRPGGGFIGTYAVVRLDKARPQILQVGGSESLDNAAPDFVAVPPAPLAQQLKIRRWSFRDSNWSPDFASSSRKALELYTKEKGVAAENITGVFAFTPTIIEELLKIIGPITYKGLTFTSDNFTEQLEYEVEYGYAKKGVAFSDRKDLVGELMHVLVRKAEREALSHWSEYWPWIERQFTERQLMGYALDPEVQAILAAKSWSGEIKTTSDDYILWADANVGALKTDWAIKRSLTYSFAPYGQGSSTTYIATTTMRYDHTASKDWRTTRYRSYARVYVPVGSRLRGAFTSVPGERGGALERVAVIDEGLELGRRWFGVMVEVNLRSSKQLSFVYELDPTIQQRIVAGTYRLLVQKQLGTIRPQLTLGLSFVTPVMAASPGEALVEHGDTKYVVKTDLKIDRDFVVSLKH